MKTKKSLLGKAIGQLNWLGNTGRPEIKFQVTNISSKIIDPTILETKQTKQDY